MSYFEDYILDSLIDAHFSRFSRYMRIKEQAEKGYWTTKDGKKIHVTKMTESHIRNAMKLLEQSDKEDLYLPWIKVFLEELKRRGLLHGKEK